MHARLLFDHMTDWTWSARTHLSLTYDYLLCHVQALVVLPSTSWFDKSFAPMNEGKLEDLQHGFKFYTDNQS
jgi:hypothetical protein